MFRTEFVEKKETSILLSSHKINEQNRGKVQDYYAKCIFTDLFKLFNMWHLIRWKDDLACWQPLANLASNTALTSTILLSVLPLPAVADGGPPWERRLQRGDALVHGAQKHESRSFVNQVAHSGTQFAPVIPWNIYQLYRIYIFVTYSLSPLSDQSIMPLG